MSVLQDPLARALSLPIWSGQATAVALGGGITNLNVLVTDAKRRAVVRIGDDIPVHQIMRFNELAASCAAHAAGVSPAVIHHEPGALVIDFVEGRTMTAEDLRQQDLLEQALAIVMHAHRDIPRHLRGPALCFWVFQVLRDYAATLSDGSSRHLPLLQGLMDEAAMLESAVGRIELVFGHNDLLPANFLHDGRRMWLIDWDYAGWNSPLFDLGGLAANNELDAAQEGWLLTAYYGQPPDADLWRRFRAMKAAAALREAMWSMVQEIHSGLDFDYAAYTADYLETYRAALAAFRTSQ
ncbi:choline/ethanolamine kinase family protein [Tabrizicola sp.]|uniref:choline/ethanolamine kinase family protein n=1 Tax=Tabrizicola sp. TaxID=2005166 RepID=UPI002620787E|nr:choline/ethanolamine kinase family protein [Tabrizicola sp.]MDM7931034.1 choline/ethanolamine kinase family protein [Tabrizicola sp.]